MKYLAEKAPAGRPSGSNYMIIYDFWSFLNDYIRILKCFIRLYAIFLRIVYDYIRLFEAFWRKIVITRRSKQLRSSYFACKGLWTCWIRFWYSQSLKLTKMICFWWFSFLTFCIFYIFWHFTTVRVLCWGNMFLMIFIFDICHVCSFVQFREGHFWCFITNGT